MADSTTLLMLAVAAGRLYENPRSYFELGTDTFLKNSKLPAAFREEVRRSLDLLAQARTQKERDDTLNYLVYGLSTSI